MMHVQHLKQTRATDFDKESVMTKCPTMEELDTRHSMFMYFCRLRYLEVFDDVMQGTSDEQRKKEILQTHMVVKEMFLVEEVRLLVDNGV